MKILVFQHIASEHPGSFREVMKAQGHSMHAVELDAGEPIPPLENYDILLVMGGPMDVWEARKHPWLVAEMAAIRAWVDAGRPYLGLCLGHQLLAQACGGHVQLMTAPPEVGMSQVTVEPDPIFAGVGPLCTCFQWHGAEVVALPPGARALATSPGCRIQAMAIGDAAYGLQFHMELTATTADRMGRAAGIRRRPGARERPRRAARLAGRGCGEFHSTSGWRAPHLLEFSEHRRTRLRNHQGLGAQMSAADCFAHTADSAKELAQSLRENSVDYVRFELPDLAGLSRGKTVPIDHVEAYARDGLNLYGGTVTLDSSSTPIENTGYNEDVEFCRLPDGAGPGNGEQRALARQYRARDLRHQMV